MERDRKAVAIHDGVVSKTEQVERRKMMDSKGQNEIECDITILLYKWSL
jgi:hypothetical protein